MYSKGMDKFQLSVFLFYKESNKKKNKNKNKESNKIDRLNLKVKLTP